jgi:hypothetical protein
MAEAPYVTKSGMVVDPLRFKRNGETLMFPPFAVAETRAIGDALAADDVPAGTELLVAAWDDRSILALSRQQMAYHHVAQGVLHGEPFVVFF